MMTEFDRPHIRPRRNRKSAGIRAMVQENTLTKNDLIMPLFLTEKKGAREAIKSMPGQFRFWPTFCYKK